MYNFRVAQYTPEERSDIEAQLTQAFAALKNKDGSLNRAAVKTLKNAEMEIGEMITRLVDDRMVLEDPTPIFVDVVPGNLGDDWLYQEVTSKLRVVDRAPGTKPLSERLSFKEWSIATSQKELVFECTLEELAVGRYTPALISQIMSEVRIRYRIGQVMNAVDAGIPSTSPITGHTLRFSGLTAGNLASSTDGLRDQGYEPSIFGRWGALAPIRNFAGWATSGSDAALREIETRGMVGQYLGAPIVNIAERFSRKYLGQVIRYDRAYISGGATPRGAVLRENNVSFLDFSEVLPAEGIFRVGIRWDDGVGVFFPDQYRVIEI